MKDTIHINEALMRNAKALGRLKGEARAASSVLQSIAKLVAKPGIKEFIHDELLRVAAGLQEAAEYEGGDEWPDIPWSGDDKPEKRTCK